MKLKRRWKAVIGAGIFFVLLAVSLHYPPKHEVNAYKALLRSRGEKLELNEVVPTVAAKDNAAEVVGLAYSMLESGHDIYLNTMEMAAPGKALVSWQQPDARSWDFTNTWDEFALTIESNRTAINQLHEVLDRPVLLFRFGTNIDDLGKEVLPKFVEMRRAVRLLAAAAVLELRDGDCGAAATNIVTALALVQKNEADGLEITHLVRMGMVSATIAPTWELLQATNVTDAQLAAVQSGWEQMNILKETENAFVVERAWNLVRMKKARGSHKGFRTTFDPLLSFGSAFGGGGGSAGGGISDMLDDAQHATRLAVGEVLWRSSWSYSDELREIEFEQVVIETARSMQTNQSQFYKADVDAMARRMDALGLTNSSGALSKLLELPDVREMFVGGYNQTLRGTMQSETARRIAISAIALKRFQLAHGKWPEALQELTPAILVTVPIDPFDGKSLKYHLKADGTYLLYSVGKDGVDNGGNPTNSSSSSDSLFWQMGRDWVWPQPAAPAEVKDYYEHPRK